jgi:hypothetical protein
MPNRILKESITTSDTIDSLSWEEEVFFYRLIVACDDYGRMDARPAVLRARCFPLRLARVTDKQAQKWLLSLAKNGIVQLYMVEGRPYLQMLAWERHQRIRNHQAKYPAADCGELLQVAADCGGLRPESNPIQSESESKSNCQSEFELFWMEYPRREAKSTALRTWKARIADKVSPDDLIFAAKAYRLDCQAENREAKFIKLPATFLGPDKHYEAYLTDDTRQYVAMMERLGKEGKA